MKKLLALDENWLGTPSLRAPPISIEISLFQCTAGASVKPCLVYHWSSSNSRFAFLIAWPSRSLLK